MSDVSEMLDSARETLAMSLTAINAATTKITATLADAETYDDKLGSHLAWVAGKVAEVVSSLRQLEKHDRVMSRTPEQRWSLVCEYVRNELSPGQRAELAAILDSLRTARVVA